MTARATFKQADVTRLVKGIGSAAMSAAAPVACVAILLLHAWFWTTHGFICADGREAVQVGTWPVHHMVCRP